MARGTLLFPALVWSLGASSLASAQVPAEVSISIDANAPGGLLQPVWAFHGYDEANYTTSAEGRAVLRALALAHSAAVHVRTHFLFNSGDGVPALKWGSTNLYTEDASGSPVYDYTLIDQIMDATVEAGVVPLVELGFMPQALSVRPSPYRNSSTYALDGGSFYPPRDYERWAELVTAWASHVRERYPSAEADWQWELWNEPDVGYWRGTFDEYARLYDHTEAALHAVFPNAALGGPAVASPESGFLAQFLEHCAAGTNAVTGQTGTRLDMVSFHAKGGVRLTEGHGQLDLGQQLRLHRAGFEAVAASPRFARTPIVISEADPDGCAACPVSSAPHFAYRNSPAYGAYEVAMMKRSLDLAAELGVQLRGVLTWAFTFPGSPFFAGYRALATNGIHLPVMNAFKLLGQLRGARLPVLSSGARPLSDILEHGVRAAPDVDALASREDERIQILLWHYHDDVVEGAPVSVALDVALPAAWGAGVSVSHERVDSRHGDAFSVWVAQGSPEAPSEPQLAALRMAMVPVTVFSEMPSSESSQALSSGLLSSERMGRVPSGSVQLSLELPRFGLALLTLTPLRDTGQRVSPAGGGGCSCRVGAAQSTPLLPLLALSLSAALARGGQFVRRARRRHVAARFPLEMSP